MPLQSFKCSVCGAEAPASLLEEGRFEDRMKWLRNHYKGNHKRLFRNWRTGKATKHRAHKSQRTRRIHSRGSWDVSLPRFIEGKW